MITPGEVSPGSFLPHELPDNREFAVHEVISYFVQGAEYP